MKNVIKYWQVIVLAMSSAVAGYLAVWIPWIFAGAQKNMIDGMQPISLLYLIGVGFGFGLVVPRRFWIGGCASMALFPIMAIVEIVQDSTSHNLLPLELVVYGLMTLPALVGGALGKAIRVLIARCRA